MRFIYSLLSTAMLLLPVAYVQAADHGCDANCDSSCQAQCPNCDHVCHFSVDIKKDPKHCYGVECKPICIPKVVFPWQKKKCCQGGCGSTCDSDNGGGACGCRATCKKPNCSCVNNGACVKYVHVLKKYEYVCEKCKYKWEAVPGCRSCGGNCGDTKTARKVDSIPPSPPSRHHSSATATTSIVSP